MYVLLHARLSRGEDQEDDDIVREEADNIQEGASFRARCVKMRVVLHTMPATKTSRVGDTREQGVVTWDWLLFPPVPGTHMCFR